MSGSGSHRSAPRVAVTLELMLLRPKGGQISGRTVDLGSGGMSVMTSRPLSVDEVVHFDIPVDGPAHIDGEARVLRMQGHNVYALRFEHLDEQDRILLSRFVGETA